MKNLKIFNLLVLLSSFALIAQETEELTVDEIRTNEIVELLNVVKANKSIYLNEDNKRLNVFINRVSERKALLADAKNKLEMERTNRPIGKKSSKSQALEPGLADCAKQLLIENAVINKSCLNNRETAWITD